MRKPNLNNKYNNARLALVTVSYFSQLRLKMAIKREERINVFFLFWGKNYFNIINNDDDDDNNNNNNNDDDDDDDDQMMIMI